MAGTIQKDTAAFKQSFDATGTISTAMVAAGYSQHSANMGRAALPKELQSWLDKRTKLAEKRKALAAGYDLKNQEQLIVGTLIDNALTGSETAQIRSVELLGKKKDIALFTADTQVGIIMVPPMPQSLLDTLQARLLAVPDMGTVINGDSEREK